MNQNKTWKELLKEKYQIRDSYLLSRLGIQDFFNFGNGRPTYEEKKEIVDYLIKKHNEISETEDNDLIKYIPEKFYQCITGVEKIFTFTELLRYHFEDLFCCKKPTEIKSAELNLKIGNKAQSNQVK